MQQINYFSFKKFCIWHGSAKLSFSWNFIMKWLLTGIDIWSSLCSNWWTNNSLIDYLKKKNLKGRTGDFGFVSYIVWKFFSCDHSLWNTGMMWCWFLLHWISLSSLTWSIVFFRTMIVWLNCWFIKSLQSLYQSQFASFV